MIIIERVRTNDSEIEKVKPRSSRASNFLILDICKRGEHNKQGFEIDKISACFVEDTTKNKQNKNIFTT